VTQAKWTDGKRTITGRFEYYWPGDRFDIWLDSTDRITGKQRHISLVGEDSPQWGKWKIVREETP
jgi:hypothetical protein